MAQHTQQQWIERIHCSSVPLEDLSDTACPVCESTDRQQLIEERGYPLWRCKWCTHVYISPRPSQSWLADLYSSEYMPDSDDGQSWEVYLDRIFEASARAILAYHPQRGDLLDVGTGFGGFLIRAEQDGWRLHGLEPNSSAFAVAKDRLRDRAVLYETIFEEADLAPGSYDGIVMTNVIEHVREPLDICRRAYTLLRPGGFLGLRWPQTSWITLNRARLAGISRTDNPIIGAPIHLHDFQRRSMELLMHRAGFVDIKHAWSSTRRQPKQSLPKATVVKLLTAVAYGTHCVTGGRRMTPFVARLTLGRKP